MFQSRKGASWIILLYETPSIHHQPTGSGKTTRSTGSSELLLKGHWDSEAPPKMALRAREVTFSEEENNTVLGSGPDV